MKEVFFLPFEKFDKLKIFLKEIKVLDRFTENEKIALKIHFGNSGHKNNIPPEYVKIISDYLKEKNAFPILTDTNVLYRGERDDTFSHLEVILKKGYNLLNVPILIAGGFDSDYEIEIFFNGKHFKNLYYAKEYVKFDGMIAVTHFKGHMLSGIGGTIKNIGMGCASRRGKFAMHSNLTPQINYEICKGCGKCVKECLFRAVSLKNKKPYIDKGKCKGCAWCVHVCDFGAIMIPWSSITPSEFQERIVEYASGLLNLYKDKFVGINFMINISEDCDCVGNPGRIISKNIGVCVSTDPVALDKCSVDLIREFNKKDVFAEVRPGIDYSIQLIYGEKIGLGNTTYKLITF